ncbi:MAG TPA: hypothetical protein VGX03_37070 [Candidatus Binatia bacterium]|nr:hypothetical protein [Candidatus Binatia bacterium]
MFPATDSKTNYVFRLSTPNDGAISLRINETNTWFLNTPAGHGAGSAAGGFNTKDGWALKLKSIRSGDILLVLKSTSKGGYYFDDPNEYSGNHGGLAKTDLNICVSASCEFPAPT